MGLSCFVSTSRREDHPNSKELRETSSRGTTSHSGLRYFLAYASFDLRGHANSAAGRFRGIVAKPDALRVGLFGLVPFVLPTETMRFALPSSQASTYLVGLGNEGKYFYAGQSRKGIK